MTTKTFTHKGQQINYFNKLLTNSKITFLTKSFDVKFGYIVSYSYK